MATAKAPSTVDAKSKSQPERGAKPSARVTGVEKAYRRIQKAQEVLDAKRPPAPGADPVQTGAIDYPANPLPRKRIKKPGRESTLSVAPQYLAPRYLGSRKLDGKAALITGGDSGIGRSVAVLFAREGCDIAIVYLKSEQADAEGTRVAVQNEGRQCILIPGDVRKTAFCALAVRKVVEAYGHLDVLVNNAAFQMHADQLEDLTDERILLTLDTNVAGYMRMARAALPHMPAGSCIINTGSRTGLWGSRNLLDYSATKGAVHAFTKALAQNVLDRGIRVNAVAPGPVWTPLNPADKRAKDIAMFGADTAFRRAAQPEEIAPAYVFLAAPSTASYITGVVLPITGEIGAI